MTFDEDMFAPEDLHADLVPFLEPSRLGQSLYHPLVHEPLYHSAMNRMYNKMYEQKTKAIEQAAAEQNWHKFIYLRERPYRCDALEMVLTTYEVDDPKTVWELVRSVWIDSENIWQNYDKWTDIWSLDVPRRHVLVMDQDERFALNAMSKEITVYRGVGHRSSIEGLSWTLSEEKARWFAKRYAALEEVRPTLVRGTVRRANVFAHFLSRNEQEIVVFPHMVNIEDTKRL